MVSLSAFIILYCKTVTAQMQLVNNNNVFNFKLFVLYFINFPKKKKKYRE